MSEDMSATPQVAEVLANLTSAVSALKAQMDQQGKAQSSMLQQLSVLQQSSTASKEARSAQEVSSGELHFLYPSPLLYFSLPRALVL